MVSELYNLWCRLMSPRPQAVKKTAARRPFIMFKRLSKDARIPSRGSYQAAGFDLATLRDVRLLPGESCLVSTGIAAAIPDGHVGIIKPRSSMACKGITVDAGVIDADYRGEIKVLLVNRTNDALFVGNAGDRIAQLIVVPFIGTHLVTGRLPGTERDQDGFGSTGV